MNKKALSFFAALLGVALLLVPLSGCGTGGVTSSFSYRDADTYATGIPVLDENESKNVTALEINWICGEVNVVATDVNQIQVVETVSQTETDLLTDAEQMRWKLDGGKLTLRARQSDYLLDEAKVPAKNLTVFIPASMAVGLTELKIDSNSAPVAVSNLTVQKLHVDTVSADITVSDVVIGKEFFTDTVSGNLRASRVQTESLHVDIVSGTCDFSGSANVLDLSATSGSLRFLSSSMPQGVEVSTVSGNCILIFPDDERGFSATFDTVSGKWSSDFATTKENGVYVFGDGVCVFAFDSTTGNVTIQRAE